MSAVKDVIQEEYNRLNALGIFYAEKICAFPKGSVCVKLRKGNQYCYRAYREKKKVRFEYLGRKDSDAVKKIEKEIDERRKYEEKKKQVNENLAEVRKLLHVLN